MRGRINYIEPSSNIIAPWSKEYPESNKVTMLPSVEAILRQDFEQQLIEIYSIEKMLIPVAYKMIVRCTDDELSEAMVDHVEESFGQKARLERIFHHLDINPEIRPIHSLSQWLQEEEKMLGEIKAGIERDRRIILSAQQIEHYEIAAYTKLCLSAQMLGMQWALDMFEDSIREERESDEVLGEILFHLSVDIPGEGETTGQ